MDGWIRVSASSPCPICCKDSNCSVSEDGKAVYCGRVASNRKQNKGGQWLHFLDDGQDTYRSKPIVAPSPKVEKKSTGRKYRFPTFRTYLKNAKVHSDWCSRYGVPQSVWQMLGGSGDKDQLEVPERSIDYPEMVVGLARRKATNDHDSRWRAMGNRGLTFARVPNCDSVAVVILEGASDCAACIASGLDPIGRYTRDQALEALSQLLRDIRDETPVVLLVENDKEGEQQIEIFTAACDRAQKLANAASRPIYVASPPREFNDYCDWWRAITHNQGHRIAEKLRHAKGLKMLSYFLASGREISPCFESLRNQYEKTSEQAAVDIDYSVEWMKLEESDGSIDMGYQSQGSCAFTLPLHRKKDDGFSVVSQYLVGFVGCRTWKCPRCRNRLVKPRWKKHFYKLFSEPGEIYLITVDSLSRAKAIKKSIRRKKKQFVAIQQLDCKTIVYTNILPRGLTGRKFDTKRFGDHYSLLMESIACDIEQADADAPKPITTSSKWKLKQTSPTGWTRIISRVTLDKARILAKRFNARCHDITPKATEAMRDASVISFDDSTQGKINEEAYKRLAGVEWRA